MRGTLFLAEAPGNRLGPMNVTRAEGYGFYVRFVENQKTISMEPRPIAEKYKYIFSSPDSALPKDGLRRCLPDRGSLRSTGLLFISDHTFTGMGQK